LQRIQRLPFRPITLFVIAIALIILLRIFLMATMPLMDTTEARYGELARVTATGNFWLMPHMTPTQPFFAKPPLSTWLAAGSWVAFGQSELALRMPSLIMVLLACLALLYGASSYHLSRLQWLAACFVIITTPIGFISAGAVMTDATQMVIVTWAMVFLWRIFKTLPADLSENAISSDTVLSTLRRDQLGFWFVLGLGAIAKGLATWVLIGLPVILFWLITPKHTVLSHLKQIWSWLGVAIFISVVLAWYVPAELHYPGFLKYFIIGEHFQRFLDPGWKGDMYGTAHQQPIGMIWAYWVVSIAAWLPVFIYGLKQDKPVLNNTLSVDKKWLWAWVLAPLLFFTFSRNIIWTYTLTTIPAFAILVTIYWQELSAKFKKSMQVLIGVWLVLMVIGALAWLPHMTEKNSARKLVNIVHAQYAQLPLYSYGKHQFSISYYTHGKVRMLDTKTQFEQLLAEPNKLIIINTRLAKQLVEKGQAKILSTNDKHTLIMSTGLQN
jgi:4-amino-4-deoxy-L-arabinose transferase-like glycosyltransferase